jgi:F0F1-type ATP synthase epsilon subunit
MKKTKKENVPASHEGKGFLTLAGEALSVLGEEIVEGKDKLVAAASEKINEVKKAIKKAAKKKAAPARKKKSVAAKKPSKKPVVKTARKASVKKKSVKKSTAGKKRK